MRVVTTLTETTAGITRWAAVTIAVRREREIVDELALEIEQVYGDAMAGGAGEEEAMQRAMQRLGDWDSLGARIDSAERGGFGGK